MTPRPTIIGTIVHAPVLREPTKRRVLFGVLVVICAVLTLYPQHYRAAVSLTPTDPESLGLSGTLGQLGAANSIFGNQAALEVSLKVARSRYVRAIVAKRLNLPSKLGRSPLQTDRWLERKIDIRALRGGIIQFEMKLRDAELARSIIAAYADAVRAELAVIARKQTAYKRNVLTDLLGQANDRLARAQTAYDTFRLQNRYVQPQAAFSDVSARIAGLESQIRGKEVELKTAREFATDRTFKVQQIVAELTALRQQLAQVRSTSPANASAVGSMVQESTEADRLRRELDIAQTLYESYKRFLQGTTVEDLTSSANVRILEPAYIDSARQYNILPLALGLLILMIAGAAEFYTLRPPVGDRKLA